MISVHFVKGSRNRQVYIVVPGDISDFALAFNREFARADRNLEVAILDRPFFARYIEPAALRGAL